MFLQIFYKWNIFVLVGGKKNNETDFYKVSWMKSISRNFMWTRLLYKSVVHDKKPMIAFIPFGSKYNLKLYPIQSCFMKVFSSSLNTYI